MTLTSAGILLFRRTADGLQVLLGHSGGPFYARKELAAWSIPKGEYGTHEPALEAAKREFTEELGLAVPDGELVALGEATQRNGKVVTVWALEADLDPVTIVPGTFDMQWPPKSGRLQSFPEIDRVGWFALQDAGPAMFAGQQVFLQRLVAVLASQGQPPS